MEPRDDSKSPPKREPERDRDVALRWLRLVQEVVFDDAVRRLECQNSVRPGLGISGQSPDVTQPPPRRSVHCCVDK